MNSQKKLHKINDLIENMTVLNHNTDYIKSIKENIISHEKLTEKQRDALNNIYRQYNT